MELLEIGNFCVRDDAEFHFAFSPIDPLKALPRSCARGCLRFSSAPHEHIYGMTVTFVGEHRDRTAFNNVQAAALQGETIVRKSRTGTANLSLASNHDVTMRSSLEEMPIVEPGSSECICESTISPASSAW